MWRLSILPVLFLVVVDQIGHLLCEESFFIPFQSKSKGAYSTFTDEWIEFENEIPKSKEITACQWIRTKYFNLEPAFHLWSYCTVKHINDKMWCFELYLKRSERSASRNVVMNVETKYDTRTKRSVELKNFAHRTWVFLCITTSSITGETKFYYNGILAGKTFGVVNRNGTLLHKSSEMYDSALIFGQEQDIIRGEFDPFQSFIGDLAELNIWNYLLNETIITEMAQCGILKKGNVVSWRKEKITLHNVEIKYLDT